MGRNKWENTDVISIFGETISILDFSMCIKRKRSLALNEYRNVNPVIHIHIMATSSTLNSI